MSDKPDKEVKPCTECKHFAHLSNVAHQNRCAKFKDKDGLPEPIAAIRIHNGKCHNGKEHEKP